MLVDEFSAKSWLTCISNKINKFLDVLMDGLPKHLLPFRSVDHKIEVVPRSALLSDLTDLIKKS
jgi:hypothetical protein